MKRRKICVVTTSRADFGLLRGLMLEIQSDPALRLQVIASGMHLAREFGRTWHEIESEGIKIDRKVRMGLTGDSNLRNVDAISTGLKGFAKAFTELKPEIVVVLGDRFELFAPAVASLMLQIPIAHIHGGELSEGAIDDSVRHAITKMASFHFAATETYRRRIIRMGESPECVFNFGAPGLDQIHRSTLLTRPQLEKELGFSLKGPIALVTYHPATRDAANTNEQIADVLEAIKATRIRAVFTMANADAQGALINARFEAECEQNPERFKWVPHLGHQRYLSCLAHFTLMVGNSSSGLTEAPSFKLPVVNIGDRQRGRVRAANVIDVACDQTAIERGIGRAISLRFRNSLHRVRNPYERYRDGSASARIKTILRDTDIYPNFLKKHFHEN